MGRVGPSVLSGSAGALSTSRARSGDGGKHGRAGDGRDNCEVLVCQPSRTRDRGNDSENDELVNACQGAGAEENVSPSV